MTDVTEISNKGSLGSIFATALDVETYTRDLKAKFDKILFD